MQDLKFIFGVEAISKKLGIPSELIEAIHGDGSFPSVMIAGNIAIRESVLKDWITRLESGSCLVPEREKENVLQFNKTSYLWENDETGLRLCDQDGPNEDRFSVCNEKGQRVIDDIFDSLQLAKEAATEHYRKNNGSHLAPILYKQKCEKPALEFSSVYIGKRYGRGLDAKFKNDHSKIYIQDHGLIGDFIIYRNSGIGRLSWKSFYSLECAIAAATDIFYLNEGGEEPKPKGYEVKCEGCSTEFRSSHGNARYCSPSCRSSCYSERSKLSKSSAEHIDTMMRIRNGEIR